MTGLELAREYYETCGRPMIQEQFPNLSGHYAAGLVGEGSQCFGFDDEISRDHDWGPAFCIWLDEETRQQYGDSLQRAVDQLPSRFLGFETRLETGEWRERYRVWGIQEFYEHFLGRIPTTDRQWLSLPDSYLAVVVNGQIFEDQCGEFTRLRHYLQKERPEDVRIKKIAACAARIAREGQYNYPRMAQRNDPVAEMLILADAVKQMMSMVYLLNRSYEPFEKWMYRGLENLPVCKEVRQMLPTLAEDKAVPDKIMEVESVCQCLIMEMKHQHLTERNSTFLQDHIPELYQRIQSKELQNLHVLMG